MTRIEIPIQLRFLRVPTRWEIRTVPGDKRHPPEPYAFPICRSDGTLEAFRVKNLDPWKCREAFFDIPEGDNERLRKFLQGVGIWFRADADRYGAGHWSQEVRLHCQSGNPVPISSDGLWRFRKGLREVLLQRDKFKANYAPALRSSPETGYQLLQEQQSGFSFPLQFELTDVASGVITLTDAYHALIATVVFDVARGIRFEVCARTACKRPFPLKNKRKKFYCGWKCAHAESEKRNRPLRPKRSVRDA